MHMIDMKMKTFFILKSLWRTRTHSSADIYNGESSKSLKKTEVHILFCKYIY